MAAHKLPVVFARTLPRLLRDPRHYQIVVLASLLAYGVGRLDFEVRGSTVALMVTTALLTQFVCGVLFGKRFDARSPLISSLSLCLLARSNYVALLLGTAVVTIASKFLVRHRGKHVFNPTNFGLVAMILVSGQVWVSPGQWGSAAYFGFLLACLGGLVVNRAARSDVTYAFLIFHALVFFGRAWWLGDPLSIPLHSLESGALLIFAFFMISDPKTTPDSRAGRIAFAALVVAVAAFVQFGLYRPNGLLWALACCAPISPLLDRLLPGGRYRWSSEPSETSDPFPAPPPQPVLSQQGGTDHEPTIRPDRRPIAHPGAAL